MYHEKNNLSRGSDRNDCLFIYHQHSSGELKNAGFRNTDISVLFPDNKGNKEFAVEKSTKAPEGATTGAGTGAVIGGALGWLTGIGLLAIPGLGPFIAAGPIMAAMAGAGAGGLVGGISRRPDRNGYSRI